MDSVIRTQTVQTLSNDLYTFNEFLSTLIMVCERLKVDIQTVKEDLRKAKRVAKQTKSKAAEDRAALTVVNVALGIGAFTTILFTGGMALPILLGTGQVIASICSSEIKKEYETNIERIMAAVDNRSKQCKQRARMVINKKKTYEKTLNTLIDNGTEKNLAIFYTVCGMLNEMRQEDLEQTAAYEEFFLHFNSIVFYAIFCTIIKSLHEIVMKSKRKEHLLKFVLKGSIINGTYNNMNQFFSDTIRPHITYIKAELNARSIAIKNNEPAPETPALTALVTCLNEKFTREDFEVFIRMLNLNTCSSSEGSPGVADPEE